VTNALLTALANTTPATDPPKRANFTLRRIIVSRDEETGTMLYQAAPSREIEIVPTAQSSYPARLGSKLSTDDAEALIADVAEKGFLASEIGLKCTDAQVFDVLAEYAARQRMEPHVARKLSDLANSALVCRKGAAPLDVFNGKGS
jgi:hypothetical protein